MGWQGAVLRLGVVRLADEAGLLSAFIPRVTDPSLRELIPAIESGTLFSWTH